MDKSGTNYNDKVGSNHDDHIMNQSLANDLFWLNEKSTILDAVKTMKVIDVESSRNSVIVAETNKANQLSDATLEEKMIYCSMQLKAANSHIRS